MHRIAAGATTDPDPSATTERTRRERLVTEWLPEELVTMPAYGGRPEDAEADVVVAALREPLGS